jgi:hypothetical protein
MTASGSPSSESTSDIRDRAHHMAGQVVDKVQEAASRMMGGEEQGAPVRDQATEQVTSRLDMGKDYLAESVTGVAQALRQTGQHLREDGAQPALATYADRGAEQVERFGGYLRQRDTGQIVTDLEGFARRQPMVFAGGAFALGMLAVRFLRSGGQPQQPSARGSSSPSYGASSASTPPTAGYPGGSATAGSASTKPPTYTGAAQAAPNRVPAPAPTSPSSGGASPGIPAAPGVGTRTPAAPPERPMPRPSDTSPTGGTSRGSGNATPTPGSGTQTSGDTSSSARPGTGGRNQP